MKRINLFYWISTGLFSSAMLFSAIPDIMVLPDAIQFVSTNLHYPEYIIPFLGWAKLFGAFVLLLPRLNTLKEWAYAGLVIDLVGATYSNICVVGFKPEMFFMLIFFGMFGASYYFHHKRLDHKKQAQ